MDRHSFPAFKIDEKDKEEEVGQKYWKISYSCLVSWYLNCETLSSVSHHFWHLFWVSSHLGEKPMSRK